MNNVKLIVLAITADALGGCAAHSQAPLAGMVSVNGPSSNSTVTAQSKPMPATQLPAVVTPDRSESSNVSATPDLSQFTSTPVASLPQCDQYSVTATVNGTPQPLQGEACQQPDGSWHIAEQPVGGTDIYQTTYWPPPGSSPYGGICFDGIADYPCLYSFPFGFSVGIPVFSDRHDHFHYFVDHGSFHHFGPVGHFQPVGHFPSHGGFGHAGGFHGGGSAHK